MMKITGLSHLFKWENLHNWWLTKYFLPHCIWNNELGEKLFFPTSYINWSVFISCCLFLYCVNLVFTGTLLIGMTAGKVTFDKLTKSTLVISSK